MIWIFKLLFVFVLQIVEGYGQTECHAVCTVTLVGDPDTGNPPLQKPTNGVLKPNVRIKNGKNVLWLSEPHSVTADRSTCITML